jgi:hypothetical protein
MVRARFGLPSRSLDSHLEVYSLDGLPPSKEASSERALALRGKATPPMVGAPSHKAEALAEQVLAEGGPLKTQAHA